MRYLILPLLFTCSLFAIDVQFSSASVANGQTALIELNKDKNMVFKEIAADKKRYKIYENPFDKEKLYAFIPINYYERPSNKKIEIFYEENSTKKSEVLSLKIEDGHYKKEKITVEGSKVTLNKKDKKRAAKEYKEAMKIYNTLTPKSYISSDFIVPLNSKITSAFGKARVYNGSLKGYHSGTDFRADVGTELIACNDGKVVLAKDRFYSGGSIIIDHGQGIYSCYFHMSDFHVKEGNRVKKGDIIGLSGKSGRVTGPHLHFAMRVAGEQVDPIQFIELVNDNLLHHKNQGVIR